jgi:predicted TIM-barrel fold metal-dependent hydrolase
MPAWGQDNEGIAMNRRDFLAATAATVGAVSAGLGADRAETKEPKAVLPIIDTHQHLWDLTKFRLPWIKPGNKLGRSHVLADYREATRGLNVVKTVYMEVDVDPAQQTAEAEYVTELCQRADTPLAAAVVSGRPASDEFPNYIAQFKNNACIKGIRQVLHVDSTPPGFCLDRKFVRGIRLLGDRGLSFDLCMRPDEMADAAKLVAECPGTRFILDHCGNGPVLAKDRSKWEKGIAEVAKHRNVVGKVSGIIVQMEGRKWAPEELAPVINHTLAVFGPDRVMFAGDWPVCTLAASFREWVGALQAIVRDRSEAEQRKLFHDNAVRVYGLEDEEG